MNELTNPQILLLCMRQNNGMLTKNDVSILIARHVFKDMKSFSNAMYQLTKNNLAVKNNGAWFITDAGLNYIENAIYNSIQHDEKTETSFSSFDELKRENEDLKKKIKALNAHEELWIEQDRAKDKIIRDLQQELENARQKMTRTESSSFSSDDIFKMCANVFEKSALVFRDIANH